MGIIVVDWEQNAPQFSQFAAYTWRNNIGFSFDITPFSANGITVITDARIDNKATLCADLQQSNTLPNAELCWHLYVRYGEDMFEKIYGDFAIIIYDSNKNVVLAATDLFGIRPIYFSTLPSMLLLAFSVKDLVATQLIPRTPSLVKLVDFLEQRTAATAPLSETFYEHIKVVKSGHFLKATSIDTQQYFYWTLPPKPDLPKTEEEYGERFREIFFSSVSERIQGHQRIASQLSGGIDSNSVTATAHHLFPNRVYPIHIDAGYASSDEKQYVKEFEKFHRLHATIVSPSPDLIEATNLLLDVLEMPSYYIHPFAFFKPSYDKINQLQCTVMLTGHDGDSIVGFGEKHFYELLKEKNWITLQNYFHKEIEKDFTPIFTDWKSWSKQQQYEFVVQQKLIVQLKQSVKKGRLIEHLKTLHQDFGISYSNIVKFVWYKIKNWQGIKALPPVFLESSVRNQQREILKTEFDKFHSLESVYQDYLTNILNNDFFQINQETALLGKAWGFEVIHPFMNRKLLEFNLFIPDHVRFGKDGIGRMPLRNAMAAYLPDSIRLRRGKTYFDEYATEAIGTLIEQGGELSKEHILWQYVDKRIFDKALYQFKNQKSKRGLFQTKLQLYRSYLWGLWLNQLD